MPRSTPNGAKLPQRSTKSFKAKTIWLHASQKTGPHEDASISYRLRVVGAGDDADAVCFLFARGVTGGGANVFGRSVGPRCLAGSAGADRLHHSLPTRRPRRSSLHGLEPMGNGAGPLS